MTSDLFHYILALAIIAAITIMDVTHTLNMDIVNPLLALLAVQVGFKIKGTANEK